MDEISKGEELEEFVTQIHDKDQDPEVVFEQAVLSLDIDEISLLLEALPIEDRLIRW